MAPQNLRQVGQWQILPNITLYSGLHVPHFRFNLLLVNKLLIDLNFLAFFLAFFSLNQCVIQELSIRRVIAIAHIIDGLYNFFPTLCVMINDTSETEDLA